MKKKYLFTSERLGFRNWLPEDLLPFAALNADPQVMQHFPKPLSQDQTQRFIERLQKRQEEQGYTYYATEIRKTGEFIGMIGLAWQDYKTDFTPATDIGWRLKKSAWGKGYAREGAKRCLEFGFQELDLKRIIAVCTIGNLASEKVMQKIGMQRQAEFNHPDLKQYPSHERCVWYEIRNAS